MQRYQWKDKDRRCSMRWLSIYFRSRADIFRLGTIYVGRIVKTSIVLCHYGPIEQLSPPCTSGSKQTRSFVSFSSPFCPHPVSHPILFQFSSTFSSIFFYPAMISPPSHHSPTYISSFSSTSFSYSSISFCILFYLNFFFNTPFHYF